MAYLVFKALVATPRIELGPRAYGAPALPLNYVAVEGGAHDPTCTIFGLPGGTRTPDILLPKQVPLPLGDK